MSIPSPHIPVGGRIQHFIHQWCDITSDPEILNIVQGLDIPILEIQHQRHVPHPLQFSAAETEAADQQIQTLLEKGAIVECSSIESHDFVSTVFLRPKKDGGFRMILNLKDFNQYVEYNHFKMETFRDICESISPGCFMAVIDLQDAYLVIPISRKHRRYLKFMWKGKIYCYLVLPFGLACAPRIFTKLLKVPLSQIRKEGHIVFMYIDDAFLQGETFQDCQNAIECFLQTLVPLGFLPHPHKSCLVPSQEVSILGFIVNSVTMRITLSVDKADKIFAFLQDILARNTITIRTLAKAIGKVVACFPATPLGPLNYRPMERLKMSALHHHNYNYDAEVSLNSASKKNIKWWCSILHHTSAPIRRQDPQMIMFTDASYYGWGAVCGKFKAQGKFLPHALGYSINTKECLAVYYGFKSFLKCLSGKTVLIRSDNTTAVSFVSKMGGMSCLIRDRLMSDLWKLAAKHNCWLYISHIPGKINLAADRASRHFNDRTEWALQQDVFNKINSWFGPLDVDLFASTSNKKLPKFVSWHPDPDSWNVDAFLLDWKKFFGYIFPPFSLLLRCLTKIRRDQATAVIIAPYWPTQTWFPLLLQLMITFPLMLPSPPALYLPWDLSITHPLSEKMHLFSVTVSGNPSKRQEFIQVLTNTSSQPRVIVHKPTMAESSKCGKDFVVNGMSVPVIQL